MGLGSFWNNETKRMWEQLRNSGDGKSVDEMHALAVGQEGTGRRGFLVGKLTPRSRWLSDGCCLQMTVPHHSLHCK